MSDVLALLALMKKDEGITEEQVKELIKQDSKMVQIDYNSPDYWEIRSMVENNEKIPYFWYNSYPNSYLFIYQAINQETGHIAFRCVSGNLTVRSQYLHMEGYWTEQVYKGATDDQIKMVQVMPNVTTYSEIVQMFNEGKIAYCRWNDTLFMYHHTNYDRGRIYFGEVSSSSTIAHYVRCDSDGTWQELTYDLGSQLVPVQYNETTYEEVEQLVLQNKVPYIDNDNAKYIYAVISDNAAYFFHINDDFSIMKCKVDANGWSAFYKDEIQKKLTAGEGITIEGNTISASGGGSSYTLLKEQTIEGSQPGLVITNQEDLSKVSSSGGSLILTQNDSSSDNIKSEASGQSILSVTNTSNDHERISVAKNAIVGVYANGSTNFSSAYNSIVSAEVGSYGKFDIRDNSILAGYLKNGNCTLRNQSIAVGIGDGTVGKIGQQGRALGSIHCTQTFGTGVQAGSSNQMVIGKCNILDTSDKYAFIIGNGESDTARSNALTVDTAGNIVCNNIPACPTDDGNYVLKCSIVGGVPTYSWVSE